MKRAFLSLSALFVFILVGRFAAADSIHDYVSALPFLGANETATALTADVTGSVTDADGSPILRARVTARDPETGEELAPAAFTDASGSFEMTLPLSVSIADPTLPYETGELAITASYPNPILSPDGRQFNVRFVAPAGVDRPDIEMFDITGRRVDPHMALASGVYFVRLVNGTERSAAQRVVIASPGPLEVNIERQSTPSGSVRVPSLAARAANESVVITVQRSGFELAEAVYAASELAHPLTFELTPAQTPEPAFSAAAEVALNEPLLLDASSSTGPDGSTMTYHWDFGDGMRGGGEKIAHVYSAPGTYIVTLHAYTHEGAGAYVTHEVEVTPGDAPSPETTSVIALVQDANGTPLGGVSVRANDLWCGLTDHFGYADCDAPIDADVRFRISKSGYADQVVVRRFESEETAHMRLTLRERNEAARITDAEFGGKAAGQDGVRVILPKEGLVDAHGNVVTGNVDVYLTPIDVSSDEIDVFPGEFRGLMPDGELDVIASFGVAEYVLTQGGEHLDLAPGKSATIEIPVYTEGAHVGMRLPLWSMRPETGLWTQEGLGVVYESNASPTGLMMRAEVTHFSWWNIDVPVNRPGGDWEGSDAEWCRDVLLQCRATHADGSQNMAYCDATVRVPLPEGPAYRTDSRVPPEGSMIMFPRGVELRMTATTGSDGVFYSGAANFQSDTCPSGLVIDVEPREFDSEDAIEIAYGDDVKGHVAVDGIQEYVFTAEEDDYVRVEVVRTPGSALEARVELIDPFGDIVQSGNVSNSDLTLIHFAPEAGQFRIRVAQTYGSGGYGLSLRRHRTDPQPISYGDIHTSYFFPNLPDVYSFEAEAGDVIRAEADRGNRFWNSTFRVLDADGNQVASSASGMRHMSAYIEEAGEYTLEVRPSPASNSGYYRLMFSGARADEAVQLDLGSERSGRVNAAMMRRYHVAAGAGDHVKFAYRTLEQPSHDPWISVFGSDGQDVGPRTLGQFWRYLFNKSAIEEEYTIVVTGGMDSAPQDFVLQTDRHEAIVRDLVPGDTIRGFVYPGEVEAFQVDGAAGTALRAVVVGEGDMAASGRVRIEGTDLLDEQQFTNREGGIAVGHVVASAPHTIQVSGLNANVHGGFWMIVEEHDVVDDGLVVEYGSRTERGMFEANEVHTYRFHGERGDFVRIQVEPHPDWSSRLVAAVEVTGPGGLVDESNLNFHFHTHSAQVVALPEDGLYTITITEGGSSSQVGTYVLGVTPVNDPPVVTLQRDYSGEWIELEDPHEVQRFQFSAAAGSWHRFMVYPGFTTTPRGTLNVVNPDYQSEGQATFRSSTFQSDRRAGAVYFHSDDGGPHTALVFGERAADRGEIRIRWSPAVAISVNSNHNGYFREGEFRWFTFELEETKSVTVRFTGDAGRANLAIEAADGTYASSSNQVNAMTRTLSPGRYFFGIQWNNNASIEDNFTARVEIND